MRGKKSPSETAIVTPGPLRCLLTEHHISFPFSVAIIDLTSGFSGSIVFGGKLYEKII